jgi:hypothetical protein
MNGVQYIGNGEFVVTEEWLVEVFSQAVSMNVADWLGVGDWQGWCDTNEAIEELYPDYAKDYDSCQGVAEAMIYDWMNNTGKTD